MYSYSGLGLVLKHFFCLLKIGTYIFSIVWEQVHFKYTEGNLHSKSIYTGKAAISSEGYVVYITLTGRHVKA